MPLKCDLDIPEGRVSLEIDIPPGPQRVAAIASRLLQLSSIAADMGTEMARRYGTTVSCKSGCGACCMQLVPLSIPEAVIISEITKSLPHELQSKVRKGFSDAHTVLEESKLLPVLSQSTFAGNTNQAEIARTYFDLGIACPFLVDESCSIHSMRPARCREYLVISPPEHCAIPYENEVRRLPISVRLSQALAGAWCSLTGEPYRLVPHILALDWAKTHEDAHLVGVEGAPFVESIITYLNKKASSQNDPKPGPGG